MSLSFAWTCKMRFVRLVTASRWLEVATWKTKLSGNKNYGLTRRDGGWAYVGKKLSWSLTNAATGEAVPVEP